MRLTDISVRALRPPEKGQVTYADDTLPGFGVRVSQGGTKTFVVVHGPTRQRTTIGRFPIISLGEARAEAKRLLAEATLGKRRPKTVTFDQAKDEFLTASKRKNRPSTYRNYVRLIGHFAFGKMKLGDIGKQEIKRRLDRLIDRPAEHRHALVAIKGLFRFAVREGYLDHSPVEGFRPQQPSVSRDRVLSGPELKMIMVASRSFPYPFGAITELLIFTGQRRGEIAALEWKWIDEKERTITLPASLTKNKRDHVFPYGDMTQDVLVRLPRIDDSPFLFPASRHRWKDKEPTIFDSWSKAKREFGTLVPDLKGWTLHDLRRTFSTTMASLGVPQIVVEKLLNHVSGGTQSPIAQVYNRHSYLEEMRAAIRTYEDYLQKLLKS